MNKERKVSLNVIENGLKKTLVFGKTGTGKSSLCNVLCGKPFNDKFFKSSEGARSCTQKTDLAEIYFNGKNDHMTTLIDTVGFYDAEKDMDDDIIADLYLTLSRRVDMINTFILVVNGQDCRLDEILVEMLRLFENMFGKVFWKHIVLNFSRLKMDKNASEERQRIGQPLQELYAKSFVETMRTRFEIPVELPFFIIDSCYNPENETEKNHFCKEMEKLWMKINELPDIKTSTIKGVQTENKKLQEVIQRMEKELDHRIQQALNDKDKEMTELRERVKTDRMIAEEERKKVEEKVRRLQNREEARAILRHAKQLNHSLLEAKQQRHKTIKVIFGIADDIDSTFKRYYP